MSLPEAWVDRIFTKLALVYGHQFLSRWDGLAIADVKANWAEELSRFQQNPSAITYALENLPPAKPPTVLEFRAICSSPQAPRSERILALPRLLDRDSSASERQLERLRRVRAESPECGRWAWALALELKDQEEPESVSQAVRAIYREALGNYRLRKAIAGGDE